jgi:hypothetical protein
VQCDVSVSDSKRQCALSCVKPDAGAHSGPARPDLIFSKLDVIFRFLLDGLFADCQELASRLGSPLWWGVPSDRALPTIAASVDLTAFLSVADTPSAGCVHMIVKLLHSSLPDTIDALKGFLPLMKAAKDVEAAYFDAGFLCSSPSSHVAGAGLTLVLASWGMDVHMRFVCKRRQVILTAARDVCTAEYHNSKAVTDAKHSVTTSGASAIATLPAPAAGVSAACESRVDSASLQVSDTILRLLRVVESTLNEACDLPPPCATLLYDTARDAVDVFRAVLPAMFGPIIKAVPRLAMLFHNDCLYLAQRLGSIAHPFRARLPPPLNSIASMVDLVPAFRNLAEETLHAQVSTQCKEVLAIGPPMSMTVDDLVHTEAFESVEALVKRQLHHVSQLAAQWGPVLNPHVTRLAPPLPCVFAR